MLLNLPCLKYVSALLSSSLSIFLLLYSTLSCTGGPGQMPHLAPTYAAVCSLCILGRYWEGAYELINRYSYIVVATFSKHFNDSLVQNILKC